jgi:hypothetical protein
MDINALKGRIAEAFVEGILRRAGYQVALVGRESRVQHLLKIRRGQFLPDFLVWKPVEDASESWPPYRLAGIEVKYRRDIETYLYRDFPTESAEVAAEWPELYFVLVTDRPDSDRSCFQAIRPREMCQNPSTPTMDLYRVAELDIHKRNVEEHERLALQILPLLGAVSGAADVQRKPKVKVSQSPPPLRLAR